MLTLPSLETRFIARQPILDFHKRVLGYELLFRDGPLNFNNSSDSDRASRKAIDSAFLIGLDVLGDGRDLFVNCTRDSIMSGLVTLLPPERTVLEVLETVTPDNELRSACVKLKKAGYRIALDDFEDDARFETIIDLVDFIKVDVRSTPPVVRRRIIKRYARPGVRIVAEKVETQQEFLEAAQLGFNLFQGFFFCKPILHSARALPSHRTTHVQLLRAAMMPEIDLFQVEKLLKADPGACYRLLRYMNSAAFSFRTEVYSIVHALALLGQNELRRWLTLVCTAAVAEGKPAELVISALVRARFCESLSRYVRLPESELFFVGLFSLLDAIFDVPMRDVVEHLAVPAEVRDALLGSSNRLRTVHDLAIAYEGGNWTKCDQLMRQEQLSPDVINPAYLAAVEWARELARY